MRDRKKIVSLPHNSKWLLANYVQGQQYREDDAPKDSAGAGTEMVKRGGSSGVRSGQAHASRASPRDSCFYGIFGAKLLLHRSDESC